MIDPSIAPVSTAALTSTLTATAALTMTVDATDAPSGTPTPGSAHCGVHGQPLGDYFLGEFVQNKADVPVTLEGCYQFCTVSAAGRIMSFPSLAAWIPYSLVPLHSELGHGVRK